MRVSSARYGLSFLPKQARQLIQDDISLDTRNDSVLQCAIVCCVCCSVLQCTGRYIFRYEIRQCVAVCDSVLRVLQCVAVYRAIYLQIRDTTPKRLQKCRTLQRPCMATHCSTLQHTAAHCSTLQHTRALLTVDMTPLIANRSLLTGDRALLQKGARFMVCKGLLVEDRVLVLEYRARIRPRMEKSHSGRPRTGKQPIFSIAWQSFLLYSDYLSQIFQRTMTSR